MSGEDFREGWSRRLHRFLRWWKYRWQRRTRGWDDSDTWSLDMVIAQFTLPRLKRFKELNNGYPGGGDMTWKSWNAMLDDMIYAMEVCGNEDSLTFEYEKVDWERVQRGLELFGRYFRDLWW